ncbi:hypothetical protein EYF80_035284 [Liparis tanakae]|uniref:Uncharacterized protein n=1 Tax=Liparis tanakae TaxID=230148 RepID=A0A4Z2GMG5_9TELE|nr:hypothetical protein EYF80_035284 [Liparis tanakae]
MTSCDLARHREPHQGPGSRATPPRQLAAVTSCLDPQPLVHGVPGRASPLQHPRAAGGSQRAMRVKTWLLFIRAEMQGDDRS